MLTRVRTIAGITAAIALLISARAAVAQEGDAAVADPQAEIDDAVAAALYERGRSLFGSGDWNNAKLMFIESLERSPTGAVADNALAMLRSANEKMGVALDDGAPHSGDGGDEPLDPYADGGDDPIDPYADGGDEPIDPYADDPIGPGPDVIAPGEDDKLTATDIRKARRTLYLWGGVVGFTAGLAIAGPTDEFDNIGGGALLAGIVGGAAGVGAAYYLTRDREVSRGQANGIGLAGVWGATTFGLLADVFTGTTDTTTNQIYKGVALGGLVGTGAGVLYAKRVDPSVGDVAVTNSLMMYGTAGGLLLGVAMDPAESEAYSLNAVFGAVAGLGVGLWASSKIETSSKRMLRVDLGAVAGAAIPWVLLYPLVSDGDSNNDEQAIGFLSTATLAGGAILAYYLTRNMDAKDAAKTASMPAMSGLINRDENGQWGVGAPALRPVTNDGGTTSVGMTVGVLGGRW